MSKVENSKEIKGNHQIGGLLKSVFGLIQFRASDQKHPGTYRHGKESLHNAASATGNSTATYFRSIFKTRERSNMPSIAGINMGMIVRFWSAKRITIPSHILPMRGLRGANIAGIARTAFTKALDFENGSNRGIPTAALESKGSISTSLERAAKTHKTATAQSKTVSVKPSKRLTGSLIFRSVGKFLDPFLIAIFVVLVLLERTLYMVSVKKQVRQEHALRCAFFICMIPIARHFLHFSISGIQLSCQKS